jgi:hypothetical protein
VAKKASIGLDIKRDEQARCVLILGVKPGGSVHAFNEASRGIKVQENDRITEVNGKKGTAKELLKAMKHVKGEEPMLLTLNRQAAGCPSMGPVDVSGLTRVALDDKDLMLQPQQAIYRTAIVQVHVRSHEFGGSDKNASGHRYDSIPIANSIIASGMSCQLIYYVHEQHNKFFEICKGFDALLIRCYPGQILADGGSQGAFDECLRGLQDTGVHVWPSPDVVDQMSTADALYKIRTLKSGLEDSNSYASAKSFEKGFRKTMAFQPRVIRQSPVPAGDPAGTGTWICKLKNGNYCQNYGQRWCGDAEVLILTDSYDNHEEEHTVAEFIEFCINGKTETAGRWVTVNEGKYLLPGAEEPGTRQIVDTRFCPRVDEGELRYNMVGDEVVSVVKKMRSQSGYVFSHLEPGSASDRLTRNNLKHDMKYLCASLELDDEPLPLLWTVDFVNSSPVGTPENEEKWIVSEFDCACVGIPSFLPACCTKECRSASLDFVPPADRAEGNGLTRVMAKKVAGILAGVWRQPSTDDFADFRIGQ